MTFEGILDQAIAMLQRRGRLTYGALKRQFNLDGAYVEDVKAELIEGQRLAVDEDGRVLVWTGGGASAPLSTIPPASHQDRAPRVQRSASQLRRSSSAMVQLRGLGRWYFLADATLTN